MQTEAMVMMATGGPEVLERKTIELAEPGPREVRIRVRAVALIAGERGSQLAGERKTAERLAKQGYPARLWVMKGAGHHYSADIDTIMSEAIAYVIREGGD